MTKRKKTDIVPLMVRLRESLRARIEAAAKAQERSLNNEIIARLEESFDRESLTRIRDQADKALTSILEQTEKRERLLELEDQKFRRAIEEWYGLESIESSHARISRAVQEAKKGGDTQDDLPQESKGDES